jgi:hypothetical protein
MEENIIKLSKNGLFPKEIAVKLNLKYYYVLKIFKKHSLSLQGSGGTNKIVNNNSFLKKNGDYWLGFISADGNLSKKQYSIYLGIKDLDHIIKYRDFINSKLKIYYKLNKANSTIGVIVFRNSEIWNYLNKIGITPTKSRTFTYKKEINWEFIRGYFDGDGSISKNEPKITTGSENFKNQLLEFFKLNNITYSVSIKGNKVFDIYIRGNSRFDFFHNIYKENSIKLDRKYIKYRAALEKFRVKNIG